MKRKALIIGFILFGGWSAYRIYSELWSGEGASGRGFGERAQPVEVGRAELVEIRDRISLVGSLRAKERVEVTPKVGGRLVGLRVDRGDPVEKGQLLARLEDSELQQQVRRAEASLQVARAFLVQREAELKNLQAETRRYQSLYQDGVVSSQQLDEASTRVEVMAAQVELAKAQMAQAEAELEELRIRLGQTEIYSPLGGVIGRRYVDPGVLLSANDPIVLILNLSIVVTVVNVPERQLGKIRVNEAATVLVDALPGRESTGHVVRISPLLDPQTRSAEVEIEIPNPDGQLKAEMFARVDLDLTEPREALFVPRDALVYRGSKAGVFVVRDGVAQFRPVEPGVVESNRIEAAGLEPGEIVVTRGANLLQNDDPIQVLP